MGKSDLFNFEINLIENIEIRNFVKNFLEQVPDYFFEVAASSTGKYHPNYALGNQGLVRHTKAAVRIAHELLRLEMFKYSQEQQDLILASLILHDTYKHGKYGSSFTVAEHPLVAAEEVINSSLNLKLEWKEILFQNISSHMGQWNTDYKTKKEILPKPKKGMQNFVHMCDYLASRKCLEFNFDAELSS